MNNAKPLPNVLVVGGASVNQIVHLSERLTGAPQTVWPSEVYEAIGGTGAGKAMNLAKLGFNVSMHSLIGQDNKADTLKRYFEHPNIDCYFTQTATATEQHTNLMMPNGERISLFTHPPANPPELDWSEIAALLPQMDLAAISILDYTRPTLHLAQAANVPIWMDLHDYDGQSAYYDEFIQAAEVIFVSSDNLPNYQAFMENQIAAGKSLVVCTHGAKGSEALDAAGRWYQQPILPGFQLVDSNGAGDAYFSGFLYGHVQQRSIQDCMRLGSLVAGMCIESKALASEDLSAAVMDA